MLIGPPLKCHTLPIHHYTQYGLNIQLYEEENTVLTEGRFGYTQDGYVCDCARGWRLKPTARFLLRRPSSYENEGKCNTRLLFYSDSGFYAYMLRVLLCCFILHVLKH